MLRLFLILLLSSTLALAAPRPAAPPKSGASEPVLQQYETRYYIIHTDIASDDAREAALRMTKMAEEYHARTAGFSGIISQKLPFYLFRKAEDYYNFGGMPGSAGVFDGERLMAIAGEHPDARTWHVVQHEGFHQFARAVIRGELPVWANEGIAEYFGEGLFTGDGFVTGLIPPWRLQRVQQSIKNRSFRSIQDIMQVRQDEWNDRLAVTNYDQAWSMVHFLAHAENGKYQKAFANYINAVGKGIASRNAWQQSFGDTRGFEQRWSDYWTALRESPTHDLYVQATVSILTSYLARASAQKQTFESMQAYLDAARDGSVKISREDWLPPSLLTEAAAASGKDGATWSLEIAANKQPRLVAVLPDKTRVVGSFTLNGKKVAKVSTTIDDLARTIDGLQSLIKEGKKEKARTLLQSAIKRNPDSPAAEQAKSMMIELK